ncbi:MAG: hypothetical protein US85_C0022G0001, partial [Candidatus Shapirobacteria bacterium GW2011_GWF1_38_23]
DEFDKFTEELNQMLQAVGQAVYAQPEANKAGEPAPETDVKDSKKSDKSKPDDKKEAEEGEVVKE